MDTLISNATIVTMNEGMDVIFGGYLGIDHGKIVSISKEPPTQPPKAIVDGTGLVAMPGLINCHTHLASAVLRNLGDDLTAREALEQQLQREDRMNSRIAKASATLGIAECLRFGITSVSDLYYYPEATAQAAAESGIKANLALSSYRYLDPSEEFDFETDEQCRELCRVVQKWHGYDHGRIRIDAGIHAEYISSYPLWEALGGYAFEQGLGMQLHLAQTPGEVESCLDRTGMNPGELLACHRLFAVPATAAGCGCLTEAEMALLGRKGVTAAITPVADAKAGRPCPNVTALAKAGMNVALGTGGAMDAGSMDLFEAMRYAAFSGRISGGGAEALPAPAALMLSTVCGAKAQQRTAECGMLKVGMDADLILVDFTAPHLMPCHNVLSGLVFSAHGSDVAMTMVRGKILYQAGTFPTIDLGGVVQELTEYAIPHLFEPQEEPNHG